MFLKIKKILSSLKINKLNHEFKIDHFGLTVPNLDEAIDFFEKNLDFRVLYKTGFFESSDNYFATQMNIHPRSTIKSSCMLKNKNGDMLSIFEFNSPDQNFKMPKNSDIGGHHIAFKVKNIEEVILKLKENKIVVLGKSDTFTNGPNSGVSWVYFLSPWGLQLELISYSEDVPFLKA